MYLRTVRLQVEEVNHSQRFVRSVLLETAGGP